MLAALRSIARPHRPTASSVRWLSQGPPIPWFVDPDTEPTLLTPPHLPEPPPPLPANTPQPLRVLHSELAKSPLLELSALSVRTPIVFPPGPRLPDSRPKGRRKRGGSYFGLDGLDHPGGIWNWIVLAQVKEGMENRGAIESVVRAVRKTLLGLDPPLTLPVNSKKRNHNWAMIDAGDFAVHVLSRSARENYFTEGRRW